MSTPETDQNQPAGTIKSVGTFKVRFEPVGQTVEVDLALLPYGDHGEPGSLLDIALENDIDLDHACGGFCSCSTCHVIVREGMDTCNEPSDEELDQLDNAPGLKPASRLACQCIPSGREDLLIEIPDWNRNRAKE